MESRSVSARYLTTEELRGPAWQIVNAVAAIHAAGYLHNNIEPGKILLSKD